MIPLVLALHTIAAVVWVGGMFFALVILRPALASLPGSSALALWKEVFGRFFAWVWAAVVVLLVSGYGVVFYGYEGFAEVGMHIRIMQITGLIMVGLFVLMWALPWQQFRHAVDTGKSAEAVRALRWIRLVVSLNLPLGLFTAAIGATGGFWTY